MDDFIALIHEGEDVESFSINKNKRIRFPRGFLRTFEYYRDEFDFLEPGDIKERIIRHMMHRDTLHWVWLKTDIFGHAREMVIKFQLINLASVLEAVVKSLIPNTPRSKDNIYYRLDQLEDKNRVLNAAELKSLWKARRSIHLHLDEPEQSVKFNDSNYKLWHSALASMIFQLKNQ